MNKVTLKFNEENNNFSGLSPVEVTIVTEPKNITDIIKSSDRDGNPITTMSFDVELAEPFNIEMTLEDEILTTTVAAGKFAVTARKNQFDVDLHKVGNKILLNVSAKLFGEDIKYIFSASRLTQTTLRPTLTTSRRKVETEVDALIA